MKKRVLAGLIALVLTVGFFPWGVSVEALNNSGAKPGGSTIGLYVSREGSDENGDGTKEKPYATLAKAVTESPDCATIYVMSDLIVTSCARFYNKDLTITSDDGGPYTLTRGDAFATQADNARSWYHPAMIEVGGTKADEGDGLEKASLRLENITLDDAGKHMGNKFSFAKTDGTGGNLDYVQDAILASYSGTGTILLGAGTTLKNFGGMSAVYMTGAGKLIMESGSTICDDREYPAANRGHYAIHLLGATFEMQEGACIQNLQNTQAINSEGANIVISGTISGINGKNDPVIRLVLGSSFTLGQSGRICGNKTPSISTVYVQSGTTAYIYGKISNNEAPAGAIYVVTNGNSSFASLYDGAEITGNTSTGKYGVIEVQQGDCTLTMNGGTISGNKAKAGTIQLRKDRAKFIMNGGSITNNELLEGGTGDAGVFLTGSANLTVELNSGILQSIAVDKGVKGKTANGYVRITEGFNLQTGCVTMRQDSKSVAPADGSRNIRIGNAGDYSIRILTEDSAGKGWGEPRATFWTQRDGTAELELWGLKTDDTLPVYILTQETDAEGIPEKNAAIHIYKTNRKDGAVHLTIPAADLNANGCAVAVVQPTQNYGSLHIDAPERIKANIVEDDYPVNYKATYSLPDNLAGQIQSGQEFRVTIQLDGALNCDTDTLELDSDIFERGNADALYDPDTGILSLSLKAKVTGTAGNAILTFRATLPNSAFEAGKVLEAFGRVSTELADQTPVIVPSNITETRLIPRLRYTVTFDAAGGEPATGSASSVQVPEEETLGDSMPAEPTRSGYEFAGWNTQRDGKGEKFGRDTVVTGNLTVYAQWNKKATPYYTLSYESNGGTSYKDEYYALGTTVQLDKVPTRKEFEFTGWYTDKTLTKRITSVTMNASQTVYAGWKVSTVPGMLDGDNHFAYIIGYPDGTVRPGANISRAEVAAIFFRLLENDIRDDSMTSDHPFTDVTEDMWCHQVISTLAKLGIVTGRSAATFEPASDITRAECAVICARFDTNRTEGHSSFTDISGHWAKAEIEQAAALGWIKGYPDGTFRPDTNITRAEAIVLLNRVLCRAPETENDLLSDMKVWPDNNPDDWYYLAVQEATNSHCYKRKNSLYESWTKRIADPDWTCYQ